MKLEKSLELASKSLKDAETVPRVDVDESKLTDMMAQAKSDNGQHINGFSSAKLPKQNGKLQQHTVMRGNKPPRGEKPMQFYQNRDSINWDVESDSDDSENFKSDHSSKFIDVTEAPLSAFSVVQPQNTAPKNDFHQFHNRAHPTSGFVNQPANGKIYQAPSSVNQTVNQHKSSHLQQQCQKLQQMQRHFRTSPAPNNTPTSPSIRPMTGALNASFITPTSSRSSSSCSLGKPAIAPKPQILTDRLVIGRKESQNNSQPKDVQSTTV